MLRSDVQDKMVETLELLQKAIRLMSEPKLVISEDCKNELRKMRNDSRPRSWKRWAAVRGNILIDTSGDSSDTAYDTPITILEGHDAVERIEAAAIKRGYDKCDQDWDDSPLMMGDSIPPIDGVDPVVVDGITWDEGERHGQASMWPWVWDDDVKDFIVAVFKGAGGKCHTPCRVAMWPGVGTDGRKVKE